MDSYHDVYYPKSQNSPFKERICDKGQDLWIEVGKEICIPNVQPWQPEQENARLDAIEDVNDFQDAG